MKLRSRRLIYALVVGLWVVYSAISLFTPTTSAARYSLSSTQTQIVRLTVMVPMLVIWLIAIHGAVSLKRYAMRIRGSAEAPALSSIATGLMWLIAYLIANSLITEIVPFFASTGVHDFLVIVRDHLAAAMALIAFYVMFEGSRRLQRVAKFTTWTSSTAVILSLLAFFGFIFVFLFASTTSIETAAVNRSSLAILPRFLLLFTLVIPYFVGWFLATLTAINIHLFSTKVKGVLYRKALRDLVMGISTILILAMTIQCITLASKFLSALSLGWLLLLVYLLLAIYGLGFMFVRSGAKKLARFEVVQ